MRVAVTEPRVTPGLDHNKLIVKPLILVLPVDVLRRFHISHYNDSPLTCKEDSEKESLRTGEPAQNVRRARRLPSLGFRDSREQLATGSWGQHVY